MPVRKGAASSAAPRATVPIPSLAENEAIIERGLGSFVEVGHALARIRDGAQYKTTHPTFEAYLQERWQMSRPYAYQTMDAATITEAVSANGRQAPTTERVARELKPLAKEPEKMAEAWQEAVKEHGPRPTAEQVRAKVQARVSRDHQSRAAHAKKTHLQDDPLVIAWVIEIRKDPRFKNNRDAVLALTDAELEALGWPRPGARLSKGTLSPIWRKTKVPGTTPPHVRRARQREAKSRMDEITRKLQIKSKALTDLRKVTDGCAPVAAGLHQLDLSELNGTEDAMVKRFLDTAFDEVVNLQHTINMRLNELQARASDEAIRNKIAVMRLYTGHEAEVAKLLIPRLEARLGTGMKLASGEDS